MATGRAPREAMEVFYVATGRDPARSIRVPDPLWTDAQRAVEKRGDPSLSHIIRGYLAQYVSDTGVRRSPASGTTNRGANRSERDRSNKT